MARSRDRCSAETKARRSAQRKVRSRDRCLAERKAGYLDPTKEMSTDRCLAEKREYHLVRHWVCRLVARRDSCLVPTKAVS